MYYSALERVINEQYKEKSVETFDQPSELGIKNIEIDCLAFVDDPEILTHDVQSTQTQVKLLNKH